VRGRGAVWNNLYPGMPFRHAKAPANNRL